MKLEETSAFKKLAISAYIYSAFFQIEIVNFKTVIAPLLVNEEKWLARRRHFSGTLKDVHFQINGPKYSSMMG